MSKISVKSVLVGIILLMVLGLTVFGISTVRTYLSSASGGEEPTGLKIETADTTATITWSTEKLTLPRVSYGSAPASLLLQSDLRDSPEPTTSHTISLANLRPSQNYYFNIKVGEVVYDNGGIPYSFKTKGDKVAAGTTPSPGVASPSATLLPTVAVAASCLPGADYNKDGVVNSLDMLTCRSSGGVMAVPTVAVTSGSSDCKPGVDYNNDGVTNSLDILSCRSK